MVEPTGMINLPEEVWDKLRELQLELDEGDITQKGYDKKRAKLLEQYVEKTSEPSLSKDSPVTASKPPSTDIKKSSSTNSPRFARVSRAESNSSYDISPFCSRKPSNASSKFSDSPQIPQGIRQEAINLAIQRQREHEEAGVALPAPTKRQSFVTRRKAGDPISESGPTNRNSHGFTPPTTYQDTPPSSIESLHIQNPPKIVPPADDYSDNELHQYPSEPHITVVDGETRIQDLPPPPDLTSDILLQNEINYQKQKANAQAKGVRLQVDEGMEVLT